jgi:hypothetical protein
MPKFMSKSVLLLLITVFAAQLSTGCAPAVSQEQYNSVQAELKFTREQLAAAMAELARLKTQAAPVQKDPLETPRKTLAALKPYIDLDLLILDQDITLAQQNTKEITESYANIQYADQRSRLNDVLKKFDDKAFANAVGSAWSQSLDTATRWQYWTQTYRTVRDKMKDNFDTLSKQLNP